MSEVRSNKFHYVSTFIWKNHLLFNGSSVFSASIASRRILVTGLNIDRPMFLVVKIRMAMQYLISSHESMHFKN